MLRITGFLFVIILLFSYCADGSDQPIDENTLGIIDADVKSEETNLKEKAKYSDLRPGEAEVIDRAFENAPPMIPHTTEGFFPVTIKNNVCLSCHMPDKVKESGAKQISETHLTNWRPKPVEKGGKYVIENNESLTNQKLGKLNNLYFNCSQCHAPQAEVTVNIENLFTPEFREANGLENSSLNDKVNEGIN